MSRMLATPVGRENAAAENTMSAPLPFAVSNTILAPAPMVTVPETA